MTCVLPLPRIEEPIHEIRGITNDFGTEIEVAQFVEHRSTLLLSRAPIVESSWIAGNAEGFQIFSNTKVNSFTLSLIDSTKPGWWIEHSVGSDNCYTIYHCPAGSSTFTAFLNIDSAGNTTIPGHMTISGAGKAFKLAGGNGVYSGSGSPESSVTAVAGSLYLNSAGGTSTTLYIKESGSGNTGWIAK